MNRITRFKRILTNKKRLLVLPLDIFLAALAFYLAGVFRFDQPDPLGWGIMFPSYQAFIDILLIFLITKTVFFILMGLYRNIWAYASTHDIILILKTTLLSSLVAITILFFYNRLEGISRSVLILDGVFLFLLLGFRSFSWRLFHDLFYLRFSRNGHRTLLIGAGVTAHRLVAELRASNSYNLHPVCFVDDDPNRIGATIQGLPVFGNIDNLDHYLISLSIDEVIITTKLIGSQIRRIYRTCEERGIGCKTLPPLTEILSRPEIGKSLRNLSLEDLLGRSVVRLETNDIRQTLAKKIILVSGAGGSIGSEVCRQLSTFEPAAIILLDNAETPLYEIDYEMRNRKGESGRHIQIISLVGDIRNSEQMKEIFKSHDVHTVFHCAAYKHVPMMELNPGEAIMNNVNGTCILADAARDSGVDRFVMISTDKAVNPVNIMGASKRIAELYIQNLSRSCDTKFITVRFGNVLGSNGSVIPLFAQQIASGGPVTVTHPDIIRYFMTIQEAAGLVIQAGTMGKGEEIFILDMGEPVKIKDLAEDMIRFAGLVPNRDIEIRYVGLRPGEKLFEELLLDGEGIQPTRHRKIHIALSHNHNLQTLKGKIEELRTVSQGNSRGAIDMVIASILPEYHPVNMMEYGETGQSPGKRDARQNIG